MSGIPEANNEVGKYGEGDFANIFQGDVGDVSGHLSERSGRSTEV
jgi:hypothetical protein